MRMLSLTFLIFSGTSRLRALPRLAGTPRLPILVWGAPREVRVTDMVRVVVITTGAGGRAEAKGGIPGLRSREGHEVIRPQVTIEGAGHRPTQEAKGETRPCLHILDLISYKLIIYFQRKSD